MALINHAKREINAKIIYFGAAGTGKSSSLKYIFSRIRPALRGNFTSSSGEPLLSFDFSPFDKPVFGDFRLRFHMYTLTGHVANPAAWKMILKGVDGIVLSVAADSSAVSAGRESVMMLRNILSSYGSGLDQTPCVLQIVSGGHPAVGSPESCAADLGMSGMPASIVDPASGDGVLDVLSRLSRQVLERIGQDDALLNGGMAADGQEESSRQAVGASPVAQEDEKGICRESEPEVATGEGAETLRVAVAAGAKSEGGEISIPLDLEVGGSRRRLIVSVSVELE